MKSRQQEEGDRLEGKQQEGQEHKVCEHLSTQSLYLRSRNCVLHSTFLPPTTTSTVSIAALVH